jgi:hypothetical protein
MFGRKRRARDLVDEADVSDWLGTVGQVIERRERELTQRTADHLLEPASRPEAR